MVVVEVKTRHGVVAAGRLGLFFNRNGPSGLVELDHAVAFGVVDAIAKNGGAALELGEGPLKAVGPVENIVAQNEGDGVRADEGFGNEESLGDAGGAGLLTVIDGQPQEAPLPNS